MKLLYTKRSPYARKVRVVAWEKKIPLELMEEDLKNKSSQLLKANPLGKVPTLILDNGQSLCDSPVICAYLDSLKPKPRLIPQKKNERLKILHLEAIADGLLDIIVAAYLEKIRHPDHGNEDFIKAQEETILRCLKFLETSVKEWEKWTLGSIAVGCAIGYIHFRMPHLSLPADSRLGKWFAQISNRPSMEATRPQ